MTNVETLSKTALLTQIDEHVERLLPYADSSEESRFAYLPTPSLPRYDIGLGISFRNQEAGIVNLTIPFRKYGDLGLANLTFSRLGDGDCSLKTIDISFLDAPEILDPIVHDESLPKIIRTLAWVAKVSLTAHQKASLRRLLEIAELTADSLWDGTVAYLDEVEARTEYRYSFLNMVDGRPVSIKAEGYLPNAAGERPPDSAAVRKELILTVGDNFSFTRLIEDGCVTSQTFRELGEHGDGPSRSVEQFDLFVVAQRLGELVTSHRPTVSQAAQS